MVASATMGVTLAGTVSDAGDVLDPSAGDLPPLSRRAAAAEAVRRRPAVRGVVWLLVSCVFFAGMNVGARVASRHVPWPEVAASRALFGALTAASVGALRGKSLRVVHQRAAWMRSLFGTTALLIGFYAVSTQSVPLGDIVTLGATSPVFIALLSAPLLGEHVGGRVWVSVPLAFAGVALVVQPSLHVALPIAGVVTVGAFASALAMIWLRKLGPGESGEAVVLHFSLVSAGAALLLSLPVLRAPDLQYSTMVSPSAAWSWIVWPITCTGTLTAPGSAPSANSPGVRTSMRRAPAAIRAWALSRSIQTSSMKTSIVTVGSTHRCRDRGPSP